MRGGPSAVLRAGVVALVLAGIFGTPVEVAGAAAASCADATITILGTEGDDVLIGTAGADGIAGLGGNDTIDGGGGKDTICGDAGADSLRGGAGADRIEGGGDDDTIDGGGGIDKLLGQNGNDRLTDKSAGADTLTGGPDADICTQTAGDIVSCEFDTTDHVVFAPFEALASPRSVSVAAVSEVGPVDLYAIVDRSGSMQMEITSIKNNFASVVSSLQCQPIGTGEPPDCLGDLWAGAGTVGYLGSGADAFRNSADLQLNPNLVDLPTSEPVGCCQEPLTFAVYATVTGQGGAPFDMPSVPSRSTCTGSPAANVGYATFGYPCFRQGALPVVVLATDEPPISPGDTYKTPNWLAIVKPQMNALQARLIGLLGSGAAAAVGTDLRQMATGTGAVDANNGNAPLVFDGSDANAATALANGVLALAAGVPLDVSGAAVDDLTDPVDAVAAFVGRVEVKPSGTPTCVNHPSDDADSDGVAETYVDAPPGTPLCWKLVTRKNRTVAPTSSAQIFRITIDVSVDGISVVSQHEVFFIVPASE